MKSLAWIIYQQRDLLNATAYHATSHSEASDIRSKGFTRPIAIIPNGVDIPCVLPPQTTATRLQAVCLSRIHPVKGLINLIKAWKSAAPGSHWKLVLAGPDEDGHLSEVQALIAQLGLGDDVSCIGAVNDSQKWQLLVDSHLFVLPSFSENFGIAVAEALAAGLPVITTTGTLWKELAVRGYGWWVPPTAEDLALALSAATRIPVGELSAMGRQGAAWVRQEFTWDRVAENMHQFYLWLLGKESRPGFVEFAD